MKNINFMKKTIVSFTNNALTIGKTIHTALIKVKSTLKHPGSQEKQYILRYTKKTV